MKKRILHLLFLLALNGCGSRSEEPAFTKSVSAPSELRSHSAIFRQRIEKAGDNIYVAIGYGLANSILIEGKDSVIIVDCMESMQSASRVKRAFDSITSKPVKAIIYTHFHTDHTGGVAALAGSDHPDIYAQELLPHYLEQTYSVLRPITEKRGYRMFGVYLDSSALMNCGIGPKLRIDAQAEINTLPPTVTFSDSLEATITGIHLKLFHAPGETPDQLFVWLPESKTLLCGDNIYKAFPNLYTIRGTPYRDINLWKNSLDKMRYLHPEKLIPSHTVPVSGAEEVFKTLTDYRDAIQFVHDQTVRGMNKGLLPDEIAETVILPPHLQRSEWLKEFYGNTEWSVRSVFDGYMGFFDGNPTQLLPLKKNERARKTEELAGGKEQLFKHIEQALAANEFQWALELTDYYLTLHPDDKNVLAHRVTALMKLGEAQANPNARHYYLTCALELQGLKNEGLIKPTRELVDKIPLASIFNGMAAHLNPKKSLDLHQRALFNFTDTKVQWMVEVRNGVAEIQPFQTDTPDITIYVREIVWRELAAKIRKPLPTYLKGEITVDGGQLAFIRFMQLFDIEGE